MSKASEYAAQGDSWRTNRPSFEGKRIRAIVTDRGYLDIGEIGGARVDIYDRGAPPEEVHALMEWLRETFGDDA